MARSSRLEAMKKPALVKIHDQTLATQIAIE
jgi:hypothetical protein